MRYKKIMILTIILTCLLAVSAVSAVENATEDIVSADISDDVVNVEETTDEVVIVDNNDLSNYDSNIEIMDNSSDNLKDVGQKRLNSVEEEVISFENDENKLEDSLQYTVNNFGVSPRSINYGSSCSISFTLLPINNNPYSYDFYLYIINSGGVNKITKEEHGDTYSDPPALYNTKKFSYLINSNNLGPGTYTAKICNYKDFRVLATCSFTINSVPYSEYTVSVKDTTISYGTSGTITMTITPTQGTYSRYDFYLKVYDSNNKEKISNRYAEENVNTRTVSYTINANSLSSGVYTIKIINAADSNHIFDTAKLTIKALPASDYSVSVNNINMTYGYSGTIVMSISSIYGNECEYNFYLQVFDSNNNLKIDKSYKSTISGTRNLHYTIEPNSLSPGTYTIKILKGGTNIVKATAKLVVNFASSTDYYVTVLDANMNYGTSATITMTVFYASKYNFNMKIFNSNNIEKISKNYGGSGSGTRSLYYTINPNDLNVGSYTIKIINTEDNRVLTSARLTVNSIPQNPENNVNIIANPASTSSNSIYYSFKIVDSNNNPISNMHFNYAIDDKMEGGYSTTDSNGVGYFCKSEYYYNELNKLKPGRHSITIYCGNVIKKTYYDVIEVCWVDIVNNIAKYKQNNYFKISVSNNWGEKVKNMKLTINVYTGKKYKSYQLKTNSNGVAILNTKNLKIGKHKVVMISDDYCHKLSNSNSNIIIKATPKLTAKAKMFKSNVKTKKYAVTLKTNQNKVMKNSKVTIKVNKKTYTAKTNSKGKATFKITKLTKKGTYKATVTYKGNAYYNKVTKKVNIKIK